MNANRTRLRNQTLLAIPLCLVMAADGSAQVKPKDTGNAASSAPTERGGGRFPRAGDESGAQGFGGRFGSSANYHRLVQSKNIMISWSKNNDELRGFSNKTGEWSHLKVERQQVLVPIVGDNTAAVRVGDTMAAFSGITGSWDILKLSKGSTAVPSVGTDVIQTTDNDRLYTFAATKGKWTSPNDPDFQRPIQPGTTPFHAFDQQAVALAQQLRESGVNDAQARMRISNAVAAAFNQRQAYQKAEAARLQDKLKRIQTAITKREALRERIIARRVNELLDLNLD